MTYKKAGIPTPPPKHRHGEGQHFAEGGLVKGMLEPGNIDLHHRPKVRNADGTVSTVRSMSDREDDKDVLYPTVRANPFRPNKGWIMGDDEAFEHYKKTGQHLGKFDSAENADAYAESLHEDQDKEYGDK